MFVSTEHEALSPVERNNRLPRRRARCLLRTIAGPALLGLLALCPSAFGQTNVLSVTPPVALKAKAGSTVEAKLSFKLREGYHVNSNTPSDEYLIPLRLTWNPGPLQAAQVLYPKPQMEKYSFSEKPLSVFSGEFQVTTRFKVAASASPGSTVITGKIRYQACNDRMCLAPKNLEVAMPVDVIK
jgi:DsbC/DsbD-like thiol-disulfide interchange protein